MNDLFRSSVVLKWLLLGNKIMNFYDDPDGELWYSDGVFWYRNISHHLYNELDISLKDFVELCKRFDTAFIRDLEKKLYKIQHVTKVGLSNKYRDRAKYRTRRKGIKKPSLLPKRKKRKATKQVTAKKGIKNVKGV